jgi:hypothetical protein
LSLDALRWALSCDVDSSAERLVLVAYANDSRNGSAVAFPSRDRLQQVTRLDPKTIAAALRKLERAGLIEPTGDHRGRTGRIPVYRLMIEKEAKNGGIESRKNGGITATETAPFFLGNDTVFPGINATENGVQNQEVKPEPGKEPGKARRELPDWVPVDAWKNFEQMRAKIGHPLNAESKRRALHTLEHLRAGGHGPSAVLEQSTERFWRGLFPVRRGARRAWDAELGGTDYEAGLPAQARA